MTAPILPPAEVEALRAVANACLTVRSDDVLALLDSHEALRAELAEYREAVRALYAANDASALAWLPSAQRECRDRYIAAEARLRALAERDTPPAEAGTASP